MRILMRAGKLWNQQFDSTYDYSANTFGSNSGNLAYQFSINRLLTSNSFSDDGNHTFGVTKYRQNFSTDEINYINANFDCFILPMANNLGRKNFISQLNEISSLVEQLKIPCVVVGIGIQTGINGDFTNLPGKEENKRFLRAILSKSKSIGVRGELTKRYILSLGFKEDQVDVIGCPSLYLNGREFRIEKRIKTSNIEKITYSFTPGLYKQVNFTKAFKDFIDLFQEKIYIAQRRDELATMLLCRPNPTTPPQDNLLLNKPDHELIINNQARFFTDFNSWIRFCQKFDFSLGTRLHGTVANILAGVPSLLLAHDSRTIELAEFHGIPYLKTTTINDIKDIYDQISQLDYNNFNIKMPSNFDSFCKFLSKNGLKMPRSPNFGVDDRLEIREVRPLISLNKMEIIRILSTQARIDREYTERLKRKARS